MTGLQVAIAGLDEAIRQAVPPWLVPAFVGITHLGNVAFLLGMFALDYWFGDHDRGAHALSLALAGMAVITALKAVFAEPRPPEDVRLITATGYSFPSGHATIATIGYTALAHDIELGPRRMRFAVAGALVVLIALSRVVLGAHFLRDVIAGIGVGAAFLVAMVYLTGHDPRTGFLIAIGLGVVALFVSGATQDSIVELGAILGAAVTWVAVEPVPPIDSISGSLAVLGIGLPVFAAASYLSLFTDLPLAGAFLLNLTLLAGVILAPLPARHVGRRFG